MSPYTAFVSAALFPLHERLKHHDTVAVRRRLESTQWWSREKLVLLQLERLRRLLHEAGRHVPYYRQLFAKIGFDTERVT